MKIDKVKIKLAGIMILMVLAAVTVFAMVIDIRNTKREIQAVNATTVALQSQLAIAQDTPTTPVETPTSTFEVAPTTPTAVPWTPTAETATLTLMQTATITPTATALSQWINLTWIAGDESGTPTFSQHDTASLCFYTNITPNYQVGYSFIIQYRGKGTNDAWLYAASDKPALESGRYCINFNIESLYDPTRLSIELRVAYTKDGANAPIYFSSWRYINLRAPNEAIPPTPQKQDK